MNALLSLIFALLALLAPSDTSEPTPVPDVQIADAVSITREPSDVHWGISDAVSIVRPPK